MTSPLPEVTFTELLMRPWKTTKRLRGNRGLRLRRVKSPDLVLMDAHRAEQEGEVVDLTAKLLRGLLHQAGGPDLIREALPEVVAWVRLLPAPEIDAMAVGFAESIEVAASVNNVAPISQFLTEWKHTAEVYADPELLAVLTRHHSGDYGPVPEPVA